MTVPTAEETLNKIEEAVFDGSDWDDIIKILTEARAAWEQAQRAMCAQAYMDTAVIDGSNAWERVEKAILQSGENAKRYVVTEADADRIATENLKRQQQARPFVANLEKKGL